MAPRFSFFISVLVISFIFANARNLATFHEIVQMDSKAQGESYISRNEKLCTLCEEYASEAISYLSENETQTQIINTLHKACSLMHSLEKQCISLVDSYASKFFLEVSSLSPEELCEKASLCGATVLSKPPKYDDACSLCHNVVGEILIKLNDLDAEVLQVIETLLKGCDKMGSYAEQCKKLAFQFGQLVLIDAETFLETNDVCTAIHACKNSEDLTGSSSMLSDA